MMSLVDRRVNLQNLRTSAIICGQKTVPLPQIEGVSPHFSEPKWGQTPQGEFSEFLPLPACVFSAVSGSRRVPSFAALSSFTDP
jgi:hypothetical protein